MPATGGETIREMLQGFNTMQMQLGLLPPQTGQMPMGVGLNTPPPPPPIRHPGDVSAQAAQQHQAATQYTLGMAQQMRYQPPPSAPPSFGVGGDATWARTLGQINQQQFNPYVANALGGGGMSIPSPIYNTPSVYGGYRPQIQGGAPPFMSSMPSIFNPIAASYQGPRFQTPADRSYSVMQHYQNQGSAAILSGAHAAVRGATGIGVGAWLGGVAGSAFGPLGTLAGGLAGSWLGEKIGGTLGDMTIGPVVQDLQNAGSLQMASVRAGVTGGANFNTMSGRGVSRAHALRTATAIRETARDSDFGRQTGYNAADMQRLTELAADQNLINLGQNADEIARSMKNVAKAVKAVVQITGDPDVKNAMGELGNMRRLGFQGTAGQMGAVANQSMFARMAGVSFQGAGDAFGMPGAMTAQSIGMAGRTGYMAGVTAGGVANVAYGAGSFDDLQLARAGGKQGVAQTLMNASLGAQNRDLYLASSLIYENGRLGVDVNQFRKMQRADINDVAGEAARRLHGRNAEEGKDIISQLSTRKQELIDRVAGQLSPMEMQMNVARQALAMRDKTGLTFGGALKVMTGGDEQVARTLEETFSNPAFYDQMRQQLEAQRRGVIERGRTGRARYRTPGVFTQAGQGISSAFSYASDAMTQPVRDMTEWYDQRVEDRSIMGAGGRVTRFSDYELIRGGDDERRTLAAMRDPRNRSSMSPRTADGSTSNYLWGQYGFGRLSGENVERNLALQAGGAIMPRITGAGGDVAANRALLSSVSSAAMAISRAGGADMGALYSDLQKKDSGAAVLVGKVARRIMADSSRKDNLTGNSQAITMEEILAHARAENGGSLPPGMEQQLATGVMRQLQMFGDKKTKERLGTTTDVASRMGAVGSTFNLQQSRANLDASFGGLGVRPAHGGGLESALTLGAVGALGGFAVGGGVGAVVGGAAGSLAGYFEGSADQKAFEAVKGIVDKSDPRAVAMAALIEASRKGDKSAEKRLDELRAKLAKEDPKSLANVERDAAKILEHADDRTKNMLAGASKSKGDLTEGFRDAQGKLLANKGLIAASEGVKKLSDRFSSLKGMEGNISPEGLRDVVEKLADEDDLTGAPAGLRTAVEAFKKARKGGDSAGREKALNAAVNAIVGMGPKSGTETSYGGAGEEGMDKLDEDIASLDSIQKDVGVFGKAGSDAEDKAVKKVFADSVAVFAKTVNRWSKTVELDTLDGLNMPKDQ